MSRDGPQRLDVYQEEDRVSGRKGLYLMVFAVAVALGGIWIAIALLRGREAAIPGAPPLAWAAPRTEVDTGPAQIHGVRQTQIVDDASADSLAARQRRQLRTFGWVDRRGGLVHIPVDEAIGMVVAGQTPGGAGAAAADTTGATAADTAGPGGAR